MRFKIKGTVGYYSDINAIAKMTSKFSANIENTLTINQYGDFKIIFNGSKSELETLISYICDNTEKIRNIKVRKCWFQPKLKIRDNSNDL